MTSRLKNKYVWVVTFNSVAVGNIFNSAAAALKRQEFLFKHHSEYTSIEVQRFVVNVSHKWVDTSREEIAIRFRIKE